MKRNVVTSLLLFLAASMPAMELSVPAVAYWSLRGIASADATHRDLTLHRVGALVVGDQSIHLIYYRFAILPDQDEGVTHERELLLVMIGERLHGWYNLTGIHHVMVLGQVAGTELVMPDGARQSIWPIPQVLTEEAIVDGKPEVHRYLFHPAPSP
jgi:hypothetical protein